ncbi:MAG: NAD(P)/FAD-dependent oxidoreductase [Candidatus Eremiobacteraeota bacterium]|nr:NAD(P)/FAD-dependent oxidoreductase [Candidatus Eremiobacteraeota bacterium]
MHRFDVAVVGSGPAGGACALRLARANFSVALIDCSAFPRSKICGEYLNHGTIRELRSLGVGDDMEAMAAAIGGMRLSAHDETAAFAFSTPAWSLSRSTMDAHIRSCAIQAGAVAITGRLNKIRASDDGVLLTIASGDEVSELYARYVVGADGMRSTVGRLMGMTRPAASSKFAIGGHYAGVKLDGWIEMFASKNGYLALNPQDESSANAMFVLDTERLNDSRGHLSDELSRFSTHITGGRHNVDDANLAGKRRSIGPLAHKTGAFTSPRVLLVGDAVKFVNPFTGQGMYIALAGARLAAQAIAQALGGNADRIASWRGYARELGALILDRERAAGLVGHILENTFASRRAARALKKRPEDFRPIVDAVSGKSPLGIGALSFHLAKALR